MQRTNGLAYLAIVPITKKKGFITLKTGDHCHPAESEVCPEGLRGNAQEKY